MTGEKQTILMNMFPYLRSSLSALKDSTDKNNIEVLQSKVENAPTLSVTIENRPYFLHSKYDPKKEAEVLIERYKDELDKYDHVLFYGVGLGYHVETLLNRYPNMNYSLFEPVPNVFNYFLESNRLDMVDLSRLKNVYIDTEQDDSKEFLINIMGNIQERIMLIALPSYERIFKQKFEKFTEDFKAAVTAKYESNYIDNKFSARWTLNSLINLPTTLSTPNILKGYDHVFKDKPLIIVSAGPSLQEEYENLKKIKRDKTAYIFAVGSANKALIANGIIPDAVCTYDPQDINYAVFTKMLEENVIDVPMIYGTSVGFETLKHYPGPKLHMITSQDTVTPYYMGESAQYLKQINDAPTIAAVTLQLACELECNPILFVGQNLALKGEQRYSIEIENEKEKNEGHRENFVMVEDVHGNLIKSTKGFINMKTYLEEYLSLYKNIKVINTTNGGAAILGANFIPLELVMEKYLKDKVVEKEWYKKQRSPSYNIETSISKSKIMEQSIQQYRKLNKQLIKYLQEMEKLAKINQIKKLNSTINVFNENMKKLFNNECYQTYIHPINRIQYQALTIKAAEMRKVEDVGQKAKLVMDSFLPFLDRCKQTLEQVVGTIYHVHEEVLRNNKEGMIFYPFDCGIFQYDGEWELIEFAPNKKMEYKINQIFTNKPQSSIKFKIKANVLRIYGSKNLRGSNKVEVIINGISEGISVKNSQEISGKYQVIYEKKLNFDLFHEVDIKLNDSNFLYFFGLEIDELGRVFHNNEVEHFEGLEVGKKIRVNYKAKYNSIGTFSLIEKENRKFISSLSSATPDGDFYLVAVDRDSRNRLKLIADRNIQVSISWENIISKKFIEIGNFKLEMSLVKIGYTDYTDNDWHLYILSEKVNKELLKLNWNLDKISSWTIEKPRIGEIYKWEGGPPSNTSISNNESVLRIGGSKINHQMISSKNEISKYIGFRPVLYLDLDSVKTSI